MRTFALSVISLYPWCTGRHGIWRSTQMARSAGFNGYLQVLPMRSWDYDDVRSRTWLENYAISYEDAFAYGPLWRATLRQLGLLHEPNPTILDWLLFGRKDMPVNRGSAMQVIHHEPSEIRPGVVVEINPELWTESISYLNFCAKGGRLCWDTWHVRRPNRKDGSTIKSWLSLLDALPSEAVKLIHVHPVRAEIGSYLRGETSELVNMLRMLNSKFTRAPAVIEVLPTLRSSKTAINFLSSILKMTKRYLN
jgi:hypothetical protein